MKNLLSIIILSSLLYSPFAYAMNQAERAGMKLIKPGLWVNVSNQTVYVSARTTEIKGGEPCEFILIGSESGHDYESLFSSDILPSEIQAALEQVGFAAGLPSDSKNDRFWPKGERVTLNVHYAPPGGRPLKSHPPENFIIQRDTKQPLPPQTWIFTGCFRKDNECLADHDTQAVIATYNETYSIFSPPGIAGKSEIYGSLLRNPKHFLPPRHAVMLSITPEKTPTGKPRVTEMDLSFKPEKQRVAYSIGYKNTAQIEQQASDPGGWVTWFKTNITPEQDWHVTVHFAPQLRLDTIHILSTTLRQIEGEHGLQIAPPKPGELYYKSFIPNPMLRERHDRPHQPIELHLRRYAENTTATLMLLEEKWSETENQFEIAETPFSAPSPKALTYLLNKHHFPSDVAFIYCAPDTSLGDMQTFAQPVLDAVKVVYIFLAPANAPDE